MNINTRIEMRYSIQSPGVLLDILRMFYAPDPKHPQNLVYTLYFDTARLDSYHEKLNGFFFKSKIRLRWYGNDGASFGVFPGKAYLENKSKYDYQGVKTRVELDLTPAQQQHPFRRENWQQTIDQYSSKLGFRPKGLLRPLLFSSYRRSRFIDHSTGTRLSLDCDITLHWIHSMGTDSGMTHYTLPTSVLEVKGAHRKLPYMLKSLATLQPTGFSKYKELVEFEHRHVRTASARAWL